MLFPFLQIKHPIFATVSTKKNVPTALAISRDLPFQVQSFLYSYQPVQVSEVNIPNANEKLRELSEKYLKDLEESCPSKLDSNEVDGSSFSSARQHGWVTFVLNASDTNNVDKCIEFIESIQRCPKETVKVLANSKDFTGRKAMDIATSRVKKALEKRTLFLSRYELDQDPMYKTTTSLIVKAYDKKAEQIYEEHFKKFCEEDGEEIDEIVDKQKIVKYLLKNLGICVDEHLVCGTTSAADFIALCKRELDKGQLCQVVFKFMNAKEHFIREVKTRAERPALSSQYVVDIYDSFSSESDPDFLSALESFASTLKIGNTPQKSLASFQHAVILPFGDRNLDAILRCELPDANQVCAYANLVAKVIYHLHQNSIVHGDIKLANIVRFGGHLRLIDLDASVMMEKGFVGAKFSSSYLPPEMIKRLDSEECKQFVSHFVKQKETKPKWWWKKIEPKILCPGEAYAVKTFEVRSEVHVESIESSLPYERVRATASIDIWSFGVVLYALCTGSSLFEVDTRDNLGTALEMKKLYEWDNETKNEQLSKVPNPFAKELLMIVLAKEPQQRGKSMHEVLSHPFFTLETADEMYKKYQEKAIEKTVEATINRSNEAILRAFDRGFRLLCNLVFECHDICTPTCFVLLPYKIQPEVESTDEIESQAKSLVQLLKFTKDSFLHPMKEVGKFIKDRCFKETYFLYLVDEYTGKAVYDEGRVYPIQIKTASPEFKKFLPIFSLGLQAMYMVNGISGIVNMFFPFVPGTVIPKAVTKWANDIKIMATDDHALEKLLEEENSISEQISVKGRGLIEFAEFLKERDKEAKFSGLRRVLDSTSGRAIWVTPESYEDIEKESGDGHLYKAEKEIANLKKSNKELKQDCQEKKDKILGLVDSNEKLEEKLWSLKEDLGKRKKFHFRWRKDANKKGA